MPRYIVERDFPDGLSIPLNADGKTVMQKIVHNNAKLGVTWVESFVSPSRTKTFCVYDAPSADAIHQAGEASGVPVGAITEVSVLTPYPYGV